MFSKCNFLREKGWYYKTPYLSLHFWIHCQFEINLIERERFQRYLSSSRLNWRLQWEKQWNAYQNCDELYHYHFSFNWGKWGKLQTWEWKIARSWSTKGNPCSLGDREEGKGIQAGMMGWELSLLAFASCRSMEGKHPWVTHPAVILEQRHIELNIEQKAIKSRTGRSPLGECISGWLALWSFILKYLSSLKAVIEKGSFLPPPSPMTESRIL